MYQKINSFFNFGDVDLAAEGENKESEEYKKVKAELPELQKSSLLNTIVCKYKLKDFAGTLSDCTETLKKFPNNVKALYWKGRVLCDTQDYVQALATMKLALQLEPNNADIEREFNAIKEKNAKFNEGEKKKYAKLFK